MTTPGSPYEHLIAPVLTAPLLERIRSRAAQFDEVNGFPHEDFQDLRKAGYLSALTPADLGGFGWDFAVIVDAQRRLAAAAPATALAVNMHLIWNGVARILAGQGDDSLEFILEESAAGEIFAFGISEPGNDSVLFDSDTVAELQPDGSYQFTGTKIFTTLAPVWTRLGIFGKTKDDQLIFGMHHRSAGQAEADPSSWDMLGMRATQSYTTRLEQALVLPEQIIRCIPVGPNADPLTFGIFASFLTLIAAVYSGITDRALELAAQSLHQRKSKVAEGTPLSQDPVMRYKMAEATLHQLTSHTQLSSIAEAITHQANLGEEWFARLVTNKTMSVRTAQRSVSFAFEASGGASFHRSSEISRLYRDVVAGVFHPSNDESAHNTLATFALGPLEG